MALVTAIRRSRIARGLVDWLALTLCQASLIAGITVGVGYCVLQFFERSLPAPLAEGLILPLGMLIGLGVVIGSRNYVWQYVLSILCGVGVAVLCLVNLYYSEQSLLGFWIVVTAIAVIIGSSLALAAIAAGILFVFGLIHDQARMIARSGAACLGVVFALAGLAASVIAQRPTEQALIRAVEKGEVKTAERLLARGISANTYKTWQSWGSKDRVPENSVLGLAAFRGDDAMVQLLLARGADSNRMPRGDHSALFDAACSGKTSTVELLLAAHADASGRSGTVALGVASSTGNVEMMELLIAAGAPLDAIANGWMPNGWTPLVQAAARGELNAIRDLIGRGAKRALEDGTAMIVAAREGHIAAIDVLIESGSSLEQHGDAALAAAISRSRREVVKHLLERGVKPKRNGQAYAIARSLCKKHESDMAWARAQAPDRLKSLESAAREAQEILELIEMAIPEGG